MKTDEQDVYKRLPYGCTCRICGLILGSSALAAASHARKHVRKGEAREVVERSMVEVTKTRFLVLDDALGS